MKRPRKVSPEQRLVRLEKTVALAAQAVIKNARRIARIEKRLKREDERVIHGFKTEAIGHEVETEGDE